MIVLQWDQPFWSVSGSPGSASDVGIYLYDSGGTLVKLADNPNVGNDPVEFLEYTNTGSLGESFQLAIQLNEGPAPTLIKYVYFNDQMSIDEFATNSSTVYGHPNAAGAEAVGAAFFYETPRYGTNPPVLEAFSSWGGTPILFDTSGNRLTSPITRQKPEIVAPDGGNTTFFGSPDIPSEFDDPDNYPNFFGTSASAPHAAAVAALMLEYRSSLTPAEIYYYMETTAIDMETPGFDYASGYGLIDANAIMVAISWPTLIAPENSSSTTDKTPTFSWNPVVNAVSYEIQIGTTNPPTTAAVKVNGTTYTSSAELTPGNYFWRVRTKNASGQFSDWSKPFSLTIMGTFSMPILNAPENGSSTADKTPTFSWNAVVNAVSYEIQIGWTNPPTTTVISVTGTEYTPPADLLTTLYYWRVRAKAANGDLTDWSDPFSVTITSPPNAAPALNFFTTGTPTLTWNHVTGTTKYQVQVARDSKFEDIAFEETDIAAGTLSVTITPALTDGVYYWRVRAGSGGWSGAETFTVDVP